jgi:hypothetical protein
VDTNGSASEYAFQANKAPRIKAKQKKRPAAAKKAEIITDHFAHSRISNSISHRADVATDLLE